MRGAFGFDLLLLRRSRVVVAAKFEVFKLDRRAFRVHGARGGLSRRGCGGRLRLRLTADQLFQIIGDLCCNFLRIFAGNGRGHRFRPVGLPIIGTFVGWFGLRGGGLLRQIPGLERLKQAQMALN